MDARAGRSTDVTDTRSSRLSADHDEGGAVRQEIWVVSSAKELRHMLADAAQLFGVSVHTLDWREADHRLAVEGVPRAAVVTDWDLRINPAACRAFLARHARLLILRGMTIEGLDLDVLEHPSVEVLPLTFELDAFGAALTRLNATQQRRPIGPNRSPTGRPIMASRRASQATSR